MKVLAIAADIDPKNLGGAEWHFVEVTKRLAPKVEKIVILATSSHKLSELFGNQKNIEIVNINYPHITNFYGLVFIIWSLPSAIKTLLWFKPTIIWAKQEYPQGVVAGLLKLITGTPIYLTCQSARLHKDELIIKGNISPKMKDTLSNLIEPLLSFSFKMANIVGAVSSHSAENARKLGAKKTAIVQNGIDTKIFKYNPPKSFQTLKIITTSSLITRNGVDTLIKSCANLKNITWQLQIAGDGPEKDNYQKLVKALRCEKSIKFLGRVENSKIPDLLSKSNLFIRLSRAEGFGSSFIEAMAIGLPVIATNVGGIKDFLKNRKNSLLVSVDDENETSKAIMEIKSNQKLRQSLINSGRETILKTYNWDEISTQVFNLMKNV